MAEKSVEIDKIREDQVTVAGVIHRTNRYVEHCEVAGRLPDFRDAPVGEYVADLADTDHTAAPRHQAVKKGRFRRRHGKIAAVGGSLKRRSGLPDEWPGDDAADIQRIDQPANDIAKLVEPLQAEMSFVGRDLEHRIGRCVADRLAASNVLFA